jgi:far upstream element-binding protein
MIAGAEISKSVECPTSLIGKVIGKGGDTIRNLQARTGCKIDINQNIVPACITVVGSSLAVPVAVKLLHQVMETNAEGGEVVYDRTEVVECDPTAVGRVIGRKGETIRAMQARSGARIQIDQNEPKDVRSGASTKITLQGTHEQVQHGVRLLNDVMANEAGDGRGLKRGLAEITGGMPQAARVTMKIPERCVGIIIGKGGRQIKQIQKSTKTTIQIAEPESMSNEREITIDANSVQDAATTVRLLKSKVAKMLEQECAADEPQQKRVHYESSDAGSGNGRGKTLEQQVHIKKQAAASVLRDVAESAQLSLVEGPTLPPQPTKAQSLAQEGASVFQVHLSNNAVRRIIGKGEI